MVIIPTSKKLKINRYRVRSVSFPSKSNPILLRLEQHINHLNRHEQSSSYSAATRVTAALSGITDLYAFSDEALSLPRPNRERHDLVDILIDGSLKLLDVCGATRDIVIGLKEAVRDVQSAVRRRKDEESVEEIVSKYTRSRKEAIKSAKAVLTGLKKTANDIEEVEESLNDDVFGVRCISVMSVSVFESLLAFLMTLNACGLGRRCGKWRVVTRLMVAAQCTSVNEGENELGNADAALHGLICSACCNKMGLERYEFVQREVEKLEVGLEGIENGLNGLFRQLIKTRASLLNLLSF